MGVNTIRKGVAMTQNEMVIEYLKENKMITDREAFTELAIRRLAARISDIRSLGYPIKTVMVSKPNRYGKKTTYAEYHLEEK